MESPLSTEKLSLGSKNYLKNKGIRNEDYVASFLKAKGWLIQSRNQKIEGIEVDIIAKKQKQYLLVEVKSLYHEDYLENILSQKQKERLIQASLALQGKLQENTEITLATVNQNKKIQFFELKN